MPEGDTIHRIANFLAPRLIGRTLLRVNMADAAAARSCTDRRVRNVMARGKHLFIELDNHTALRSHLGMYGSWHFYAPSETWRKPSSQVSLVVTTAEEVYVCFNAKEIQLVEQLGVRQRVLKARLGPDLISDDIAPNLIARRARDFLDGDLLLADALLDQRIACGIGNVYKSEVLFIEGWSPLTRLDDLTDAEVARCFLTAASLLKRNLGGGPRVTRFVTDGSSGLWVYGRRGRPCLRCDGRIESARLGRHHRSTYWCGGCQNRTRGDKASKLSTEPESAKW